MTAAVGGRSAVTLRGTGTGGSARQVVSSARNNQGAQVEIVVATRPAVLVRDECSNPVPNVAVTFAVASGGGSVTGADQTTDASGLATLGSWTLGPSVGPNTLTAAVPGLTAVTFSATGTAGGASSVVISAGNNQSASVGTAVATRPAVRVTDAGGNPVLNVAVTLAVASGGGSITGADQTTDASGLAALGS